MISLVGEVKARAFFFHRFQSTIRFQHMPQESDGLLLCPELLEDETAILEGSFYSISAFRNKFVMKRSARGLLPEWNQLAVNEF